MMLITDTDLLRHETVYIVGSGPNGKEYYDSIPKGSIVMVCNKAIMTPIDAKFWICEDSSIPNNQWFHDNLDRDVLKIFSDSIAAEHPADYGFRHKSIWKFNNPDFCHGSTYGGATVCCRATQLCAMSGAKNIILIGVDMSGNYHFDGSEGDCQIEIRRKGRWLQTKAFDDILIWLKNNLGCRIVSMSETELKLARHKIT